jgi:hypothetical protein
MFVFWLSKFCFYRESITYIATKTKGQKCHLAKNDFKKKSSLQLKIECLQSGSMLSSLFSTIFALLGEKNVDMFSSVFFGENILKTITTIPRCCLTKGENNF